MISINRIGRAVRHLLMRCAQTPRVWFHKLISTNAVRGNPKCYQPLQCAGVGTVTIDEAVKIGFFPSPFFFSTYAYVEARSATASIKIGAGTWLNNNFCAIAEHTEISIGKRCLIGSNVEILDSDFHGMQVSDRGQSRPEWAKPVTIEDDVFIGSNARVLKGVTIGHGAVVANCSVVNRDVPAGVIVGGNPARVIRSLASLAEDPAKTSSVDAD